MPQTQLWELATYDIKPRLNRMNGVSTVMVQGGQEPEFQIDARPREAAATQSPSRHSRRRAASNMIDSPGLIEHNHQLVLGLVSGQARTPEEIAELL